MPNPGRLDSILLLAGSHPSYKLDIASSSSFPCLCPISPSLIYPRTPGTCCFKGCPCHSTSKWVLPMIGYLSLHNPHTSRSSPPASVPPSLIHTFLLALLSLLPFPPPYATSTSTPILLPTTLLRDTFAPSGYLPHILCTSSSLPSSHAVLLSSLAVPLYLDSPIGRVLPPHTPSTLLAALFPRRGMP